MEGKNRLLDVMGLSRSRFPELSLLLETEPACGPPVAHTRKRANAHARRHRSLSTKGDRQQGSSQSRHKRRRPHALLANHNPYTSVSNDSYVRWLETHIWHAKRMHMRTQWGWCLAGNRADMGCSAAVRAAQHRATVHDATYTTPIEIRAKLDIIMSVLECLGDPQSAALSSMDVLMGEVEVETMVYVSDKFPRCIIGPVRILLSPFESSSLISDSASGITTEEISKSLIVRQCWLFCHPSISPHIRTEIERAVSKLETKSHEPSEVCTVMSPDGGVVRLEVRGAKAMPVLKRIGLLPSREDALPRREGEVMGVRVYDPRHLRFAGSSPQFKDSFSQVDGGDWVSRRRKARSTSTSTKVEVGRDELHEGCVSVGVDEVDDFWGEMRKETSEALSQLKDHEINRVIHELRLKNQEGQINSESFEIPKLEIPALVIRRSYGDANHRYLSASGYDILLPENSACMFLHALVMAGCTAIGLDESCALRSDVGLGNFPIEYPDSMIGHQVWKHARDETKSLKKKTKKRIECPSHIPQHARVDWLELFPNFNSIESADECVADSTPTVLVARNLFYVVPMFECPFPNPPVPILLPVQVIMNGRGVPRCGAAICIPFPGDETPSRLPDVEVNSEHITIQESELIVIGYVTSGSYSQIRGCGFGVGLCSILGLQHLLSFQLNLNKSNPDSLDVEPLHILKTNKARVVLCSPGDCKKTRQQEVAGTTMVTMRTQALSTHGASVGLCS